MLDRPTSPARTALDQKLMCSDGHSQLSLYASIHRPWEQLRTETARVRMRWLQISAVQHLESRALA